MGNDRALYIGPSHATGGIPVVVDGVKKVEVEGLEYKICGDAYRSNEKLSFTQKTNIEILDFIHHDFSCKFDQNKASGSDFIICKLAVRDMTLRDRSGTVKEILDQMQGEVGCKLSDGTLPDKKMKKGGLLPSGITEKAPLYGNLDAVDDSHKAIVYGQLDLNHGILLQIVETPEDLEDVSYGTADLIDYSSPNIALPGAIGRIVEKAITLPGNTVAELQLMAGLPIDQAGNVMLDYHTIDCIKTIADAAKILGYDGLFLANETPISSFVWSPNLLVPVVINNPHNFKYFETIGKISTRMAEGGEIKVTGYDARVHENLKQMDAPAEEWRAVPVTGFNAVLINGKEKEMPIFDFPVNYQSAPSLYKNNSASPPYCCELCGKDPILTFYWIQNDKKSWTLGVGSECIKHFQAASGQQMLRETKVEAAKMFAQTLREICFWLLRVGYKKKNDLDIPNVNKEVKGTPGALSYLPTPKRVQRDMSKWSSVWQDPKQPFVKNHSDRVFLWSFYDQLYPFDYNQELASALTDRYSRFNTVTQKWETAGPPDPETCRQSTEKKLLSWYSRNKEKKIEVVMALSKILANQDDYLGKDSSILWVKSIIDTCNLWNEELLQISKPIL